MHIPKDLVAASAAPLVLGILAEGESYGYAIVKRVRELSDGEIEWTDGLLYPLLHRLEELEQVEGAWGTAENGRKRKYYRITPNGRESLADHRRQWQAVIGALRGTWGDVREMTGGWSHGSQQDWRLNPVGGLAT
jgi:DNA-binding PadR family transcriptional regulator